MTFPIIIDRWSYRPRRRSGPLLHSRPKSVIFPIVTAFWSRLYPPKRFSIVISNGLYIEIINKTHQKRRAYFDKSLLNNIESVFFLENQADRTNFRWRTTPPRRQNCSRWWQLIPHSFSLKTCICVHSLTKRQWRNWSHRILN